MNLKLGRREGQMYVSLVPCQSVNHRKPSVALFLPRYLGGKCLRLFGFLLKRPLISTHQVFCSFL